MKDRSGDHHPGPWRVMRVDPEFAGLLVAVGFCGAYTTFSTLSLDVFVLLQERAFLSAATYVAASVVIGVLALFGGFLAGDLIGRA